MISARSLLVVSKVLVAAETFQSHLARELELENALLAITSPGQQLESAKALVDQDRDGTSSADGRHARFYQKISILPASHMSTLLLLSSTPIASR
jgi:hypothetical protein